MILHPNQLDAILDRLRNQPLAGTRGNGDFADLRYRGEPNVLEFSQPFDLRALFGGSFGGDNPRNIPVYFGDFSSFPPSGREHMGDMRLSIMTALQEGMRRFQNHLPDPPAWMARHDEMEHETRWRGFVRSFAGATRPPRHDLDPESFAVEAEEAAYCSTNLHTATADYLDAFVRDYESMFRMRGVVFLFGFEDMHLNPLADRAIRQALRGLVHPRLAFLFARSLEENTAWPPDPPPHPLTAERNARIRAENEANRNRPPPPPVLSPLARALLEEEPFG